MYELILLKIEQFMDNFSITVKVKVGMLVKLLFGHDIGFDLIG